MTKAEQAERLKEMQRLYEDEELRLREIAERFGVSWQAIHERLVRAKIPLRPKSAVKRFLDRETLIELYINENLTIAQTAHKLKIGYKKVSDEIKRHGIVKRPRRYFSRKYTELNLLNNGQNVIIPRPSVKNPYLSLYGKAKRIGIQISIKSVNNETFQIKRIK
jgi:predicted DNA-binding protein YlxM (UPF0122 family)